MSVNTLALSPPLLAMKITLPTELLADIFKFAACCNKPTPPGKPSQYTLQLVSRAVRKWTHPLLYAQLRIFSTSRMMTFVEIFDTPLAECMVLLGQSVRDFSFLDDRTRSFDHFIFLAATGRLGDVNAYLVRTFELCKSLKRLSVNYIAEDLIVPVDGARPQELTVERRLHKIDKILTSTLFENVTKLHFRGGQLTLYVLKKLPLNRLTHICFRQYLPEEMCLEIVSKLVEQKNIKRIIVEMAYEWPDHCRVRKALAEEWPQEDRLMVRVCRYEDRLVVRSSRYELSHYEENVFKDGEDVWDVDRDSQWREAE